MASCSRHAMFLGLQSERLRTPPHCCQSQARERIRPSSPTNHGPCAPCAPDMSFAGTLNSAGHGTSSAVGSAIAATNKS